MESYDLSRNKLSGAIPLSISTLKNYSCLNLSFNLSGHIPSGNQLKTSDDKCIYIGNNGLCGHQIKSCPEDETFSEGHERIEDKINDQPGACWFSHGLIMGVVAGLWVCSNFHFMKSWRYAYVQLVIKIYKIQRVATAKKKGKQDPKNIMRRQLSSMKRFSFSASIFLLSFTLQVQKSMVTCPFGEAIVFSCGHGF